VEVPQSPSSVEVFAWTVYGITKKLNIQIQDDLAPTPTSSSTPR